ncbi:MAG: ParB N-terminal domain-containing protein [Chitinophagales bacterium]|nr:ParB N-terminal domain-containing protein [Chitinophagales bacterium]
MKHEMGYAYCDQIEIIPGFNTREDFGTAEQQAELKTSIKEEGILVNCLVRETDRILMDGANNPITDDAGNTQPIYEIFDGARRLGVATMLTEENPDNPVLIPLSIYPKETTETQMLLAMLITGTEQKQLTPYEQAKGIERLAKLKMKGKDIADKIGKTPAYVTNCLKFMKEASPTLKEQVKAGAVTMAAALDILNAAANQEEADEIAKEAAEHAEKSGKKRVGESSVKAATKKRTADPEDEDTEQPEGKPAPAKSKMAPALDILEGLYKSITAQPKETVKPEPLEILDALIRLVSGKCEVVEIAPLFIVMETPAPAAPEKKKSLKDRMEEAAAEDDKPATKKAAKKATTKKAAAPKATAKKKEVAKKKDEPAPDAEDEFDDFGE